jgi:chemotaxis protein CheD
VTENLRSVSIGEMVVSDAPSDVLVAYGLGSCVAICLYDPVARVGGMLHALLPTAPEGNSHGHVLTKFVEQGVPLLIDAVLKCGAARSRLTARLCGGAQMLTAPGFNDALNIGKRNVQVAENTLKAAGLRIQAQDTGGQAGRTVKFYLADGKVVVKTMGREERLL